MLQVSNGAAQILMSEGTYSQNFDSLTNSGADHPWTDNATLPGWYAATNSTTVKSGSVVVCRASSGSTISGGLYSFGDDGASERALGSLASGGPGNLAYNFCFTNHSVSGKMKFFRIYRMP